MDQAGINMKTFTLEQIKEIFFGLDKNYKIIEKEIDDQGKYSSVITIFSPVDSPEEFYSFYCEREGNYYSGYDYFFENAEVNRVERKEIMSYTWVYDTKNLLVTTSS